MWKKLSIVIPVYNAEKTVESLCNSLISLYGNTICLEIVLVNDCSSDGTDPICRRLQQSHAETITYIRLAKNFGEHNALMAGLNHADGDFCVTMDDDFQNPPEEIQLLLDEIKKGYDVVYSQYDRKNDHWGRNLGSWFNDRMATLILRKPGRLYLSSFKIMNHFLVREIIKYTGPDPYIDGIILRSTSNIGSAAIRHGRRASGESGYTFRKLLALWGNMVVSYSMIPIRILGFIGFCMTIIGIVTASNTILDIIFKSRPDPTEYEILTSVITFFRGFQLLAIGVVGEYVGRIYLSLNQDPQFVIREQFPARQSQRDQSLKAREQHGPR